MGLELGAKKVLSSGAILSLSENLPVSGCRVVGNAILSVEMPDGAFYATYFTDIDDARRAAYLVGWVMGEEDDDDDEKW